MKIHVPFRALRNTKAIIFAAGVCASMLTATASQAQLVTFDELTEPAFNALGPTAITLMGSPPNAYTTYSTPVGTPIVTVTDGGDLINKYLVRRNQQGAGGSTNNTFGGDFANATPLLRNVVTSASSSPTDGMLITFTNPVSAFGFNFDPTQNLAPTNFTFLVSEGAVDTPFARTEIINFGAGDGSAPFFGVQEAGGNLITSIRIYGAAVAGPFSPPLVGNSTPNDFAIGLLRFNITPTAPPVPEPGTLALLAASGLPVGLLAARRRRCCN